jgi:NADPH:quinone reductase-like Zn-dependent oxidoreductase
MKLIPGYELPTEMRALLLSEFNANPKVQQMAVPAPGKKEVLVKIDSSPVNPSDNSFIRGVYSTKKQLPVIPGFEASGQVVATGDDFMSRRLLGKSVACFAPTDGNGTWAEYMVTRNNLVIPLKKGVDIEQGSMLMVNPLSVLAMVEIAIKGKHKAIANTAAASALGKFMIRICAEKKLPLVNIVRREEQVTLLKSQGARYVLNSSDENFSKDLKEVFHKLQVTLAYDAIAGQSVFDLLEALPSGGEVMVYGGLSEQGATIHPGKLIFENKKVSGFWLSEWLAHKSTIKLIRMFNKIQRMLSKDHLITINRRVSLEDTVDGIASYLDKMTVGKILVKPGIN